MSDGLAALLGDLLRGTRWLDAVIVLVLLEAAALLWWHRRTGRGPGATALLPNLAAGLCLMLALRAALSQLHPLWPALALAAAGAAHCVDLHQRGVRPR